LCQKEKNNSFSKNLTALRTRDLRKGSTQRELERVGFEGKKGEVAVTGEWRHGN